MIKSITKIALTIISLTHHIIVETNSLAIDQSSKSSSSNSLVKLEQSQYQYADNKPMLDTRRPVWNLAHMVNSIKELDYRLAKGANAVEVDVTFGREGDPLYTYHGPPCDCWRHCHQQEDFNEYLKYVREITTDETTGEPVNTTIGKNLTLLFLDLKLDYLDQKSKARAGVELAKSIRDNLFVSNENRKEIKSNQTTRTPVNLILSINHVNDVELVLNFVHFMEENNSSYLMDSIGFDVGMNDNLNSIETMWKKYGRQLNLWQGDGFTNCFSPFYNLERLSKAVLKRDHSEGYPRKVYQWTIDLHDRIREALRMNVDAIMTNHPERVLTVLHEPEMSHQFRLATRDDEPFKKIIKQTSASNNNELLARHQRSAQPTSGGFFGGLFDVVSSWIAYVREIPFLSLPTRFMSASRAKHRQRSTPQTALSAKSSQVPELRQDNATNDTSQNGQSTSASPTSSTSDLVDQGLVSSNSDSSEENNVPPYGGPKWYTSLLSNFLVSMLKIALPVQ